MAGDKGLATLIRLAKWSVDEKRRTLVALQSREDQVRAEIAEAETRLRHEQQVAAAQAELVGFAYAAYARAWLDRRAALTATLDELAVAIAQARDDLAEAFGELKTYEITLRERQRRAAEERDRKEQAVLDEIGLTIHRRRGRDDAPA